MKFYFLLNIYEKVYYLIEKKYKVKEKDLKINLIGKNKWDSSKKENCDSEKIIN